MIKSVDDLLYEKLGYDKKFKISKNMELIKIDVGLAGEAPNSAIWLSETKNRFVIGIEPLSYHWKMLKNLKTANSKREYPKGFKFIQLEKGYVELDGKLVSMIEDRFCGIQCAIDDVGKDLYYKDFYEMDRTDGASGSSSLLKPNENHPHFIENILQVPVVSLESILDYVDWNRFPFIEHIKTDCEGKDFDVVRSIGKYLDRVLYITSEMAQNTHHWDNSCSQDQFKKWMYKKGFSYKQYAGEICFINNRLEFMMWRKQMASKHDMGLNYKTLGH